MVARYYVPENNPDGASIPGVPLRDLTDEEFDALPTWDQASVDAWSAYRKTNPHPTPRARSDDTKET